MDKEAIEKYWIPRSKFLQTLYNEISILNSSKLELLSNVECVGMQRSSDGADHQFLHINGFRTQDNTPVDLEAELVVGCDGINSVVRRWLQDDAVYRNSNTGLTQAGEGTASAPTFETISYPSDSSGAQCHPCRVDSFAFFSCASPVKG